MSVNTVSKTLTAGFPRQYLTKLRYVEAFTINPSAGLVNQHVFRANDIYDPNYTGVGHQPMGRDLLASVYQSYIVVGSKITVKFLPTYTSTAPLQGMVGIRLSASDSSGATDAGTIMEQGNGRYKVLNMRSGNSGNPHTTMTMKFGGKKWFGWKNSGDNTAMYAAPVGTSPSERAYFLCFAGELGSSADVPEFTCVATIDYIVKFYEPVEQLQS